MSKNNIYSLMYHNATQRKARGKNALMRDRVMIKKDRPDIQQLLTPIKANKKIISHKKSTPSAQFSSQQGYTHRKTYFGPGRM